MASGRIHRVPLLLVFVIVAVIGAGGGAGVYFAAERRDAGVQRVNVSDALTNKNANNSPAENYLLVGSDSRENLNPDDPEGGTGGGCKCSDTIMILRRHPDDGASLLSIPRDLWVTIPGHGESKINAAYGYGPDVIVETVQNELAIPIHHYVEIDFAGFISLVDAIGGVEICVEHLSDDTNTGMLLQPGCQIVDGAGALSFARSRHFREFIDDEWVPDNKNDFGRMERQQTLVTTTVNQLLEEVIANPERLGDLIDVAGRALKFDDNTNLFESGEALAAAAGEGLQTFSLNVEGFTTSDNQAALRLLDSSEPVLAYFRGDAAQPVPGPDGSGWVAPGRDESGDSTP